MSKDNDFVAHVRDANAWGADWYISLHSNATGGTNNGSAQGCEVYYFPGSKDSQRLAQAIYNEVAAITPTRDRGLKSGAGLFEVNSTTMPAVLVEAEFHDYKPYADWIKSNLPKIADAIVKGILAIAGGSITSTPSAPAPTPAPAKPSEPSLTDLAQRVIRGEFGTGEARKNALGARYVAVQTEVNRILGLADRKSTSVLAQEVLAGKHGDGEDRKKSLGARYAEVQAEVNKHFGIGGQVTKPLEQVAREVYRGNFGNEPERSANLRRAGYDPAAVQREVNRIYY